MRQSDVISLLHVVFILYILSREYNYNYNYNYVKYYVMLHTVLTPYRVITIHSTFESRMICRSVCRVS